MYGLKRGWPRWLSGLRGHRRRFSAGVFAVTAFVLAAALLSRPGDRPVPPGPADAARPTSTVDNCRECGPTTAVPTTPAPTLSPTPTPTPTPSPAPPPPALNGGFAHPGVLVSRAQLDFVRRQVSAGAEPWRSAFAAMQRDAYAALPWIPAPRATVDCGSGSVPNNGCTDERRDALAAYTDALLWYLTGDSRYARQVIAITDAWASTVRTHTNSNAPIQTGWSGATFARAGELLRYSYTGWDKAQLDRFAGMLRTVYLPEVLPGEKHSNGNHELIELDAATSIAVFLDDHAAFARAVAAWRVRVPAYIYLGGDGALPRAVPGSGISGHDELVRYWQGQATFTNGLAQETCRDFGHTGWGLEAATHVAATAWIQGLDLYGEMRTRMTAALEFHAGYELGAAVPAWLCGGTVHLGLGPTLEMAYNHYHNRLGVALPGTGRLVVKGRPAGANYFLAWETLTNADNPYA
jgi:hypothetical protein